MSLVADVRYALRRLASSPGFTLNTVLMLALGIAICTLMAGVLRGVFGSLPFPEAEQVVVIEGNSAVQGVFNGSLTPAEVVRLAEADSPFAHVGYYDWNGITVLNGERPREVTVIRVSEGFFPALGMPTALGRWFNADDFASGDSVVLAHVEWQRLFGGDPKVIGRTLATTAGSLRVIGVMPPSFAIPSDDAGGWRSLPADAFPADQAWTWNARFVSAVARLDPTLSPATLNQRLDQIGAELADRHHLPQGQWQMRVRPMLEVIVGDLRGVLWGALAVAVLVLLIACANVAILIDARQLGRRHEQAVEQALGASRQRLYRGLLLEIGVVALLAVALGVGLALLGMEVMRELARSSLPRVDEIAIDATTLGIAIALGLLVPLVAAMAGALRPRGNAVEAMRSGGRGVVGGSRRRAWLPIAGVALSTISLVAGSALLFSLWRLQAVDPGLRHENVYALQLFHEHDGAQRQQFAEQLQARLRGVPAVQQVAVANASPLSPLGQMSIDIKLPERAEPEPYSLALRRVSPEFADLLEIPLLAGRLFTVDDRGGEKVAVINRELAARLFGADSALDRRVELPLGDGPRVTYRIVGVVGDLRNQGLRSAPGPELWVPLAPAPSVGMTFLVAAGQPLAGFEKLFADALHEIDPQEAATLAFPLSESIDSQLAPARFFARTIGGFALASLLLAAFGVYAVGALRQQQRSAEFGLRLAIGARPAALVWQLLAASARSVGVGLLLGLAGAWAVLRLLQAHLFGVADAPLPAVTAGAAALLVAALAAAALPAMRAARVDPMRVLRDQ
ncbi:MAG: ABC transporter permease [Pseudomarimonas sp.]